MTATSPGPHRRRGRTRLLVAASALALPVAPALSGCSFGTTNFDSQTNEVYNPAQGVNDRSGDVAVLNALIVSDQQGRGRLIAGLLNDAQDDDALAGVQGASQDQTVTVSNAGGSTDLAPGTLLQLADPDAATIVVSGDSVQAGAFVPVTFSFQTADPVTLDVPVVAPGEDFANVQIPAETAPASPSASPSGSPSGSPS